MPRAMPATTRGAKLAMRSAVSTASTATGRSSEVDSDRSVRS